MAGIRKSGNRPKLPKHLRSQTTKKFRNENPEALKRYNEKMNARATRKLKKKR